MDGNGRQDILSRLSAVKTTEDSADKEFTQRLSVQRSLIDAWNLVRYVQDDVDPQSPEFIGEWSKRLVALLSLLKMHGLDHLLDSIPCPTDHGEKLAFEFVLTVYRAAQTGRVEEVADLLKRGIEAMPRIIAVRASDWMRRQMMKEILRRSEFPLVEVGEPCLSRIDAPGDDESPPINHADDKTNGHGKASNAAETSLPPVKVVVEPDDFDKLRRSMTDAEYRAVAFLGEWIEKTHQRCIMPHEAEKHFQANGCDRPLMTFELLTRYRILKKKKWPNGSSYTSIDPATGQKTTSLLVMAGDNAVFEIADRLWEFLREMDKCDRGELKQSASADRQLPATSGELSAEPPPHINSAEFLRPTNPVGRKLSYYCGTLFYRALLSGTGLLEKGDAAIAARDAGAMARVLRDIEDYCRAAGHLLMGEAAWEQSPTDSSPTTEGPATPNDSWPPDGGWHFRTGEAAFLGIVFPITGRLHGVMKKLAEARGAAVTWSQLADAISPDTDLELKTVTGYVSQTRSILRQKFSLGRDSDPIPAADWGGGRTAWRLDSERLRGPAQKQS